MPRDGDRLPRFRALQDRNRTRIGRRRLEVLAGVAAVLTAREVLARLREADLHGEVAFITGGSRGLGLLLARELARQGCRVAVCARDSSELDRARGLLEQGGAEVLALVCDVGDAADVGRAVAATTERFGRIDILVNNAGTILVGPVQGASLEDFEHAHRVIYWGTLYPTLAVLPQMIERRRGRIVNVTSIGGRIGVPHLAAYSAAKFATVGLSEALRAELRRDGITVTTIVPGLMRTGSYVNALFREPQEREFTWFSLASTLPLASMDAARAARQIVTATRRGEAERTLGITALLATRFHGLFPGLTADLAAIANRLLPAAPRDGTPPARAEIALGQVVERRAGSRLLRGATVLGRVAGRGLNQRSAGGARDDGPSDVADRT